EFSDDAIVSKTLEGVVTSWNAGAERLYGYSAAEAVGRPISIIIPPDHPNELLRVLARVKRGEHVQPYEATRIRKDGSRVQVSITVSPLRSSSGIIIGASAIGRDITEKKRAEAALREAATLRSVASLAVAAAHEINNPLTVVSGELQLLAREAGARWGGRVGSMLEALERIGEVVMRMNQMTRRAALLLRDRFDPPHQLEVLGEVSVVEARMVAPPIVRRDVAEAPDAAGEPAASERRIGDERDAQLAQGGEQLLRLDSVEQRELALQRAERMDPMRAPHGRGRRL